MSSVLTADESSFQKAKSPGALVAYKAAADIVAKLSLFALTVVAARRLTPAAFGVFSLGSTLGWMAAVAADFGIQLHLARAAARAPHDAARLFGVWLRVRFWTAAGALVVVVVGVAGARADAPNAGPIVLLALVYAVGGLIEFLNYLYRGLSRSDIESSLTIWQRVSTLVCGLVALAWRPSVSALALAMLVPGVATLMVSLGIARRLSGNVAQPSGAAVRAPRAISDIGREFRDVAPIGAGILLSALYFRVDLFLVQLWAGTESVALYNAVFRVIEGLRLFPAAALAVALPVLCRARDLRTLARVSFGVLASGCAATALLWATADWLVPLLFGERYTGAVSTFRILLLSFPLFSLNYALTHQLIGWDGQRAYVAICAAALVANVVLNTRLIPNLSIDGAAWATLGTEVVVTSGCLIALARTSAPPSVGDRVFVDLVPG